MVSFSCENCGDVLTKKKLDAHRNQCYGASFTCLDCMVHFQGTEYRSHTSCISEAQKYQGALYKEKKPKTSKPNTPTTNTSQALVRHAYVEDAPDADTGAVAVVDAPPRAPSPPPAAYSLGYEAQGQLPALNVFDFLVDSETPNASKVQLPPADESRMIEDKGQEQEQEQEQAQDQESFDVMKYQEHYSDDDYHYVEKGFAYGGDPVRPANERFDSYYNVREQEPSFNDSAYYTTPAPKPNHQRKKSRDKENDLTSTQKADRKRKRQSTVGDLDMALVRAQTERDVMMTDAPPVLHSGLTGGLNRLLARPDFPPSPDYSGGDFAEASPLSPIKRAKQSTSKALARAHKEHEAQEERERKAEAKAEREREKEERGRERERKQRKASNGTTKAKESDKLKTTRKRESRPEGYIRRRRHYSSSPSPQRERRQVKAIEYHRGPSTSPAPDANGNGALIVRANGDMVRRTNGEVTRTAEGISARAELFMSFVTKGPESGRGMSVNKALKRYHRERYDRWDRESGKAEEEKELWKSMRLKRNDRGEIVLFFAGPDAV